MSGAAVRVLVVEDSPTVRHCLRQALSADPDITVVAEAADGAAAVDLCRRLRPDVVTMDVVLPGMSGLAATERIMAATPTPILVVSAAERSQVFTTYDALAAGAVDVMEKPRGDSSDGVWGQRLRASVRLLARVPVVTRHRPGAASATRQAPAAAATTGGGSAAPAPPGGPPGPPPGRPRPGPPAPAPPHPHTPARGGAGRVALLAVGASTGGPAAVVALLCALPEAFRLPVLLVQHMAADGPFVAGYADWLGGRTGRDVAYARGGEEVAALHGRVVLAPPDRHLTVQHSGRLYLSAAPPRHSCRPSVDTLFDSVATAYGPAAAACLLSGMGSDGASGLLAVRQAGGHTFAQDEATCVVYGMPKVAVGLGAVDHPLPPAQMGRRLAALAGVDPSGGHRWRTRC
ncbi:MAG TPA: chemotaxis-specific protein-glutamate methyltransferase CheB [Pilimelia sp.]|nr:chemotaxis-specific protein-glutamate methyltransferase CheB [Pilimelia sp.]